jgi:hypothetical protein
MVLVHDDDLARLDGICDVTVCRSSIYNTHRCIDVSLLQRLDADVTLSHIRSLKPTLHNARIGELFTIARFATFYYSQLRRPPERFVVHSQQR